MEQHPFPLLLFPHPHPVAVKSLIIMLPPKGFCLWFIICDMACMCLLYIIKILIESLQEVHVLDMVQKAAEKSQEEAQEN